MQNKANLTEAQMNINLDMKSNYKILSRWLRPKNKANSNPIKAKFKANSNPMSKPLLGAKPLQAQSAKMAQKLTSSNHQNNTREKYNFLSTNMLNGLIQYNPPTGTSFAYLRPEKMQLLRKEYKNV